MNADNNKLGRGLGSLLSPGSQKENKRFKFINITEIHANKDQPRESFKKEELEELANSIKSQGILQPIVVRPANDGLYQIIAGERRWRAAQLAGLHEMPALIKEMSDELVGEQPSLKTFKEKISMQ